MSIFKKILSFILCFILLIGCMTGCKDDYKETIIYFELLQKPKTLDPQMAQNDSELLVIRNIYEGLMREDEKGKIVCGVSKSYTVDDLTYTFKLRDDAFWSDGEKVTAYDFEYAFHRAVDPKIKAPFVSRLFSIENAEKIANGEAEISSLGVKAIDSKTLRIKLCRKDENFLKTLTSSVCMPCREDFFEESIGKYGLDVECIISNGSYHIQKWNKQDFGIRLYKNEQYKGDFEAQNAAVFISCIEDETQISRLSEGESDMAFVLGDELKTAEKNELTTEKIENICWVLTISNNFSPETRKALCHAFSTDIYKNSLPSGFKTAKSIYPEIMGINTEGVGITKYDIDTAKELISNAILQMPDKKFPQSTLYYYDIDGIKNVSIAIVGHWQQNLSAFINIEPSDNLVNIQKELDESTLDFALFPITAKSSDFGEYSQIFNATSQNLLPSELQSEILKDNTIIPVAYQTTNISYIKGLENVVVGEDNGYIDFSGIIKRK